MIDVVIYVLQSAPKPLIAASGKSREAAIVSLHEQRYEADSCAQKLRSEAFKTLADTRSPADHFVQRMLEYRESIVVVPCNLTTQVIGTTKYDAVAYTSYPPVEPEKHEAPVEENDRKRKPSRFQD